MISLPLNVADGRVSTLFPTANSSAFKYDDSYIEEDTLWPGKGYWLKFPLQENITIIGTTIPLFSVDMKQGWNLVGSLNEKIPSNKLATQPCGIISSDYFLYNNSYVPTDTLEPGKGYWVKVNEAGELLERKWKKVSGIYQASVTVHPAEPNVLYAGTHSNFSAGIDGAILKSTNWGATWDTLVREVDAGHITIDQTNPDVAYASLGPAKSFTPGILKTTNGGSTWFYSDSGISLNWENGVGWIKIDPNNSEILYTETGGIRGFYQYKSTNGGIYWFPLIHYDSLNCPNDTLCWFRAYGINLVIDPQNSNILYAVTCSRSSLNMLFQSMNAGSNWDIIYRFSTTTLGYPGAVYVDLYDSNTLYLEAKGFYRSTDNGQSWQNSSNGLPDPIYPCIHLSKNQKEIYIATISGSIFRSTDMGINWQTVIIDSSYIAFFQDLDEIGLSIYSSKIDTGYYHPTEIDGIYRLKICK